jgi:hypothetical protein
MGCELAATLSLGVPVAIRVGGFVRYNDGIPLIINYYFIFKFLYFLIRFHHAENSFYPRYSSLSECSAGEIYLGPR